MNSENVFKQFLFITTRTSRSETFKIDTNFIKILRPVQLQLILNPIKLLPKVKSYEDHLLKDAIWNSLQTARKIRLSAP